MKFEPCNKHFNRYGLFGGHLQRHHQSFLGRRDHYFFGEKAMGKGTFDLDIRPFNLDVSLPKVWECEIWSEIMRQTYSTNEFDQLISFDTSSPGDCKNRPKSMTSIVHETSRNQICQLHRFPRVIQRHFGNVWITTCSIEKCQASNSATVNLPVFSSSPQTSHFSTMGRKVLNGFSAELPEKSPSEVPSLWVFTRKKHAVPCRLLPSFWSSLAASLRKWLESSCTVRFCSQSWCKGSQPPELLDDGRSWNHQVALGPIQFLDQVIQALRALLLQVAQQGTSWRFSWTSGRKTKGQIVIVSPTIGANVKLVLLFWFIKFDCIN